MTGGRSQGTDEFGPSRVGGAFVTEDTARGLGEAIDVEDDGGGIRQDVEITADLADLEHAVRDGRRSREGVIGRGADDPGTRALLAEGVRRGCAVGENRYEQIIGGARASEHQGLIAGHRDLQGAVDGERTGAAGVDEDVRGGRVEKNALRERGRGTEIGQRTRSGSGIADLDAGRTVEGADVMERKHALVDLRRAGVGGGGDARPEGDASGAARTEDVRRT